MQLHVIEASAWCKWGVVVQVDKAQEGTGDNHAISALKFKIIQEFLGLGWNVLLSDVDVVVVQVSLAPDMATIVAYPAA